MPARQLAMGTIFTVFIIFLFLIFAVPFGFFMVYVIKKSTEKKAPEFLALEKYEMTQKVNELKQKIQPWNRLSINTITNSTLHSYKRWTSRIATGRIQNSNYEAVVAFKQIERGLYTEGHIVATTTAFDLYFVYTRTENTIYYDGQLLGVIANNGTIYNAAITAIGTTNRKTNRRDPDYGRYSVFLNDRHVAEINKSSSLNNFRRNILYKPHGNTPNSRRPFIYTGPKQVYELVKATDDITEEELKWVNAIGIFECVLYSIDIY